MIVTAAQGVTLIGGGAVTADDLALALPRAPVVVSADGGADTALAHGLMPAAVIGDFDSISAQARAAIPADRQHPIAEQDSTDFAKCLARVAAPFFLGVGFSGPRLDHALSALTVLVGEPRPVVLIGGEDIAFAAPPDLALDLPPGSRVSLWPLGAVSGRSEGLEWPIDGLRLAPDGRTSTSNRATGPVRLRLSGPAVVILPRAALGAALVALGVRAR